MNIVQSILKLFFGTKSDKDRKEIQPYVDKVLALYPQIDALSNDELRGRSAALRANIAEFIRPEEERIAQLKEDGDEDEPVENVAEVAVDESDIEPET